MLGSRAARSKATTSGRLVLHADGSIDTAASDAHRAAATDPSKSRSARKAEPPKERLKPVPETAVSAVGESLREHGLVASAQVNDAAAVGLICLIDGLGVQHCIDLRE